MDNKYKTDYKNLEKILLKSEYNLYISYFGFCSSEEMDMVYSINKMIKEKIKPSYTTTEIFNYMKTNYDLIDKELIMKMFNHDYKLNKKYNHIVRMEIDEEEIFELQNIFKDDIELFEKLIEIDERYFELAPNDIKSNIDIVFSYLLSCKSHFAGGGKKELINETVFEDKKLFKKIFENELLDEKNCSWFSKELYSIFDNIEALNNKFSCSDQFFLLKYFDCWRNDKEFILKRIKKYPELMDLINESLYKDIDFMKEVLEINKKFLKYLPYELYYNSDIFDKYKPKIKTSNEKDNTNQISLFD